MDMLICVGIVCAYLKDNKLPVWEKLLNLCRKSDERAAVCKRLSVSAVGKESVCIVTLSETVIKITIVYETFIY